MTLHTFPAIEQRSDEWYDQRRGLVTASVVGSLLSIGRRTAIDYDCPKCGATATNDCRSLRDPSKTVQSLHPERTAYAKSQPSPLIIEPASNDTSRDLTALLAAERISGITEETSTTNDMWRGIECEPLARDKYSECFAPVTQTGFMVRDDWGFRLGYSPDGLVGDDGLCEIKSPRAKNHVKTVLSDGVPMEYMPQLQAGLLVSGREWIDFVSFSAGMRMWRKRVYRQPKWFEAIVAAVRLFEDNAAEMMRLYDEATDGLPMTERRVELEII
ncbi:lambda exonuclease family protein [Mycolicibacterium llatzerense]|uniref:lambda exonuclease family protein n=1 Tax=Mycolicibacterium llatzerense TaxID=280871 RepID=UPI0021B4FD97|nr:lambda exonuclease family protein [Mycolicibacterium llatzerense]MCT7361194.1 hypothetical protein [Mycolicibacterium llatzerense]